MNSPIYLGRLVCCCLSAACVACTGFINAEAGVAGLNHHTRLDRQPLTSSQRPDSISAMALDRGRYRTGREEIVSEAWPAAMDDVAPSLPQSRCLWLGEGEGLRLHWEQLLTISDEGLQNMGLDRATPPLGMCRMNDPITRQPPAGEDGSLELVTVSAGQIEERSSRSEGSATVLPVTEGEWAVFEADVHLMWAWLSEYPTPVDELNICDPTPLTDPDGVVDIAEGVLRYNGPYRDGLISSCSGPHGQVLFPVRDAVYGLFGRGLLSGDPVANDHIFQPAIKVANGVERLARPMSVSGAQRSWATPSEGSAEHNVFWVENFSRRIHTRAVRLFRFVGAGQREYLNSGGEPLCITDPATGNNCRWTCAPEPEGAASVYHLRADAGAQPGCRLAAINVADHPAVTPTYAKDHLCDRATDAQCKTLIDPLLWSVPAAIGGSSQLYIEFEIEPVFEGMALRVSPLASHLGTTPVDEKRQATFEVINIGGVPIEIDVLQGMTLTGAKSHVQAWFLTDEQPHPMPLRIGEDGVEVSMEMFEDARLSLAEGDEFLQLRRRSRDGTQAIVRDHAVMFDGEYMIRDEPGVDLANPELAAIQYPVHVSSFVHALPPKTLMPDERVTVLVNITPTAYHAVDGTNRHRAWLHVEALNLYDPGERQTAAIPLTVDALMGPQLEVFPPAIGLPRRGDESAAGRTAALLIGNYGDVPLELHSLTISGPDAGQFHVVSSPSLPQIMAPADAHVVRIEYLSQCDAAAWRGHRADLDIASSYQDLSVRLRGAPSCTLEFSP